MLKQFIPNVPIPKKREKISHLLKIGNFHDAFKEIKKNGYYFSEFQRDIQIGAQKMVKFRRANELMGYMFKYGFETQYKNFELLLVIFETGDYHGFLKKPISI